MFKIDNKSNKYISLTYISLFKLRYQYFILKKLILSFLKNIIKIIILNIIKNVKIILKK